MAVMVVVVLMVRMLLAMVVVVMIMVMVMMMATVTAMATREQKFLLGLAFFPMKLPFPSSPQLHPLQPLTMRLPVLLSLALLMTPFVIPPMMS